MTRFEAAALLNACLERVTEQTDELQRLLNEFQNELTVLRGRVDGLEKKVGKLEAQQFSTTTKLQGESSWVLGGVGYSGLNGLNQLPAGSSPTAAAAAARNAVSFNYDLRLNLNTSFTGKDLLFTRLRAGNFGNSAFTGTPVRMAALDKAFGSASTPNTVEIDRLFYRFPLGKEFTAIIGPRVRNTEMLSFRPQAYNADLLDFFTLAGAPNAYNKATGTGFGLIWKQNVKKGQPYLTASANYVAQNGQNGNPAGTADQGGLFNAYSASNVTVQIGGRGQNWGAAALYRYGTCGTTLRDGTTMGAGTLACNTSATGNNASTNSLGLGAFWQPKQTGIIPSISLGWGYTGFTQSVAVASSSQNSVNNVSAAQSWAAMFQWDDAFAKGNSAGFAFGQGSMATALRNGTPDDSNYAFEWFYRFRVSDNISITPSIFYLSSPNGQASRQAATSAGTGALNNTGFLVQTQFKF